MVLNRGEVCSRGLLKHLREQITLFSPDDVVCLMVEIREGSGADNPSVITPPFSMLEPLGLDIRLDQ